jgi:FKBP-type peptidyl-prolyl cis-trans isomerase
MKIIRFSILISLSIAFIQMISGQELDNLHQSIIGKKLATKDDSLTYALAILNYSSMARENISPDPVVFAKALIEARNGNALMSDETARNIIMAFVSEREAKQAELDRAMYKDYIEANEAFLLKNREKPGITVTPSGLQYEVLKLGTGPIPARENTVKVHYTGMLIDGTEFDSSIKRNAPAQFPLAGVIAGWTEGLQLMPVGSKYIFYIPQQLGYGAKGAGEIIKPYSTLIFEVELLDIVK